MENLPNLLHSLAVDGNARKEKGSGERKKKRQSEKMAMKQSKSCGNLQTETPAKTMQKNYFRWKPGKVNARMKMKTKQQQLLSI